MAGKYEGEVGVMQGEERSILYGGKTSTAAASECNAISLKHLALDKLSLNEFIVRGKAVRRGV